jgi:hypothetical protein
VIKQKSVRDCAICCIAAATGWSYEEVVKRLGDYYDPYIGFFNTKGAWERLGLKVHTSNTVKEGVKAFVSFRVKGSLRHMCYWDGDRLYDPGHSNREWKGPCRIYLLCE